MSVHLRSHRGTSLRALLPLAVLLAVTATLAALGAPAAAATGIKAGRTGLAAFQRFMSAELSSAPAWESDAKAYVTSVSTSCPGALSSIGFLQATSKRVAVVKDFVGEAAVDVNIAGNVADRGAFTALSGSLSKVRWPDARTARAVHRFVAAGHRFLRQIPGSLCADATAIAKSNAETVPIGTAQTVVSFVLRSQAMQTARAHMLSALKADAGPAGATLGRRIKRISKRVNAALNSNVIAETKSLMTVLGLPIS